MMKQEVNKGHGEISANTHADRLFTEQSSLFELMCDRWDAIEQDPELEIYPSEVDSKLDSAEPIAGVNLKLLPEGAIVFVIGDHPSAAYCMKKRGDKIICWHGFAHGTTGFEIDPENLSSYRQASHEVERPPAIDIANGFILNHELGFEGSTIAMPYFTFDGEKRVNRSTDFWIDMPKEIYLLT